MIAIETVTIDLFNSRFKELIKFKRGLNIICGENGTGKTRLLQQVRSGTRTFYDNVVTHRIVAFNPKRNAQKQTLQNFVSQLRSQSKDLDRINNELNQLQFNDIDFTPYPSFGELFILSYESLIDEGTTTKQEAVRKVSDDFNSVLRQIFPGYEINGSWNNKVLEVRISKNGLEFPFEGLSLGESEALSLVFNIYSNRDKQDIFLIDEPESHLNWNLEEGLFKFLKWFTETYNKQIITTTHSRIVYQKDFLDKIQYLVWEGGKINVKNEIDPSIKSKIAGETVKIITSFDLRTQTFIVEDVSHKKTIEYLTKYLRKEIEAEVVPNGSGVIKGIAKALAKEGSENLYFLTDGDNQDIDKDLKLNERYIHLKKYCVENYYFNFQTLASISKNNLNTEELVKKLVNEILVGLPKDSKIIVFQRLGEKGEISEDLLDNFDCSRLIDKLSKSLGFGDKFELMEAFIEKSYADNTLSDLFKEIIQKFK